jgi:hypothetical protein
LAYLIFLQNWWLKYVLFFVYLILYSLKNRGNLSLKVFKMFYEENY